MPPRPLEVSINLPTLHSGQVHLYEQSTRFTAARCGRRWGKTVFGETLACDTALKGGPVGWFAPDYKTSSEVYDELVDMLEPAIVRKTQQGGLIKLVTGGRIDFWTLDNERAGRSRKYKRVIIDEAAFTKPNVLDIWRKSIEPTLLDLMGDAWVLSNTNGTDPANFFWRICNEPEHGFTSFHAPTRGNPHMPVDEIERLRKERHPLVFQQEYEAEFVDWSGSHFFELEWCLEKGEPIEWPALCEAVFATIDTGSKSGIQHDGTAVCYWAIARRGTERVLCLLDWDIIHIEGALLETWLPNVFLLLSGMAVQCKARMGTLGAFIEDKDSGTILLQQAKRRGWAAHACPSDMTALGKDGRAMSVSGYVFRGWVKITRPAFDKVVRYKDTTQNHFLRQVFTFRIGIDNKQDDLLDTFTYGAAIAFGDRKGH